MQFLPLLEQDTEMALVQSRGFDDVGCQTSRSPSPKPCTLEDFVPSLEDMEDLVTGLVMPVAGDTACAPPAYSDSVTDMPTSSLGLDFDALVAGAPSCRSLMPPALGQQSRHAAAATSKLSGVGERSGQQGITTTNLCTRSFPSDVYMRARPMIWDVTSSTMPPSEARLLDDEARHRRDYPYSDYASDMAVPPWRCPSIAEAVFRTPSTHEEDAFTEFSTPHAMSPSHTGSLSYRCQPNTNRNSPRQTARIETWTQRSFPSQDTATSMHAMPGTYPPSPTAVYSPWHSAEACHSAPCSPRRTRRHCCETHSPDTPTSTTLSDLSHSAWSSANSSPDSGLRLSIHNPLHFPYTLPRRCAQPTAHSMDLSMPAQMRPSVVNISISLPSSCSHQEDASYHRFWSICTILLPLALLIPFGTYICTTLLPSSRSPPSSFMHGPLLWRAISSLLSCAFHFMKDSDAKI